MEEFGNPASRLAELLPDRAELECEDLFAQADRLLNEGLITEAVEKLSTIIKRNPRFGKAYNHLGWVFETKYKNFERAEEYYKAAIQWSPYYNAPYLNYAYFLSNLGRFDELDEHLEKMTKVSGIAKETISNERAVMCEMQGDIKGAIDYYQSAVIVTLDNNKLEKYRDSIERCRKKLAILSDNSDF